MSFPFRPNVSNVPFFPGYTESLEHLGKFRKCRKRNKKCLGIISAGKREIPPTHTKVILLGNQGFNKNIQCPAFPEFPECLIFSYVFPMSRFTKILGTPVF